MKEFKNFTDNNLWAIENKLIKPMSNQTYVESNLCRIKPMSNFLENKSISLIDCVILNKQMGVMTV